MIRIEQASVAQAAVLARLNLHVHQLHVQHAPRFFLQPSDEESRAAFAGLLARANVRAFLAYSDDTPAGYVLASVQERPAGPFNPARRLLYIDEISVEPEWEGQRIGRQLMSTMVEYARTVGIDELETDVWAFNTNAQEFFRVVGFQPKHQRFWMRLDE
jgi:diamine N-acetyltransferase